MKYLVLLFILVAVAPTGATIMPRDTIDNWQVYHGSNLLIAGNGAQLTSGVQVSLKKSTIGDLTVQFNHCSPLVDLNVTIELIDPGHKKVFVKKSQINSDLRIRITSAELKKIPSGIFKIRYIENIKDGTDIILGQIKLID